MFFFFEIDLMYTNLRSPICDLKIIFVTPEKIVSSIEFEEILLKLYKYNNINRFVIDEAHYPKVPIMLSIASVTNTVCSDILLQLKMTKRSKMVRLQFRWAEH